MDKNSDIVTDGYVARKKFDTVIRKSGGEKILTDSRGNWIEVYYYTNDFQPPLIATHVSMKPTAL